MIFILLIIIFRIAHWICKLHFLFSHSEITENSTISWEEVSGNKTISRSSGEEIVAINIRAATKRSTDYRFERGTGNETWKRWYNYNW